MRIAMCISHLKLYTVSSFARGTVQVFILMSDQFEPVSEPVPDTAPELAPEPAPDFIDLTGDDQDIHHPEDPPADGADILIVY